MMGNKSSKKPRRSHPAVVVPPLSPVTFSSPPTQPNLTDGVTLIWLDSQATSTSDQQSLDIQMMFKRLNSSVLFYDDIDRCINLLYDIKNRKIHIFIIVSGKFSRVLLSHLHLLENIDSVFIYCLHPERYDDCLRKYSPRLVGIFSDEQQLKSCVELELDGFNERAPTMNFFAQQQNATRDLTYDAASFLWFQIIQQVLRETHYGVKQKEEMLDYCRDQYARHKKRNQFFAEIEEFQKTYRPEDAIHWYTRQSFIYRLINSALRTEDIDALFMFRFYISDLCRQLDKASRKYRRTLTDDLIVYRGCRMTKEELDKLKESVGREEAQTSINGFTSTSLDRKVAEEFKTSHSNNRSNIEHVVWTIKVDRRIDEIIYADISPLSAHPEESEVLFGIGTIFVIDQIELKENIGVWFIEAHATNQGITAVKEYLDLVRQELEETSIKVILGILLIDMGKFVTARRYIQDVIEHTSDEDYDDLSALYYNFGLTYRFEGELDLAETNFLQAIEYLRQLPKKRRNMVRTYNALGHVYQINGELQEAINSYKRAESIYQVDDIVHAQTYTYMAQYYFTKEIFDQSMEYYERALIILRRHLPADHHRIGILLCEMGNVRQRENRNDDALKLYQEAEECLLKKLPKYHPCTAFCWSKMGILYLQMNNVEKAQEFHSKALDSYRRVLPADHPNIRISEENLQCHKLSSIVDSYLQIHFSMQTNGVFHLEHVRFCWLEQSPEDFKQCRQAFCNEISVQHEQWKFFDQANEFHRYLLRLKPTERTVLIASGSLLKHILDDIHSLCQLHSIYIYCQKPDRYLPWQSTRPKIRGVFTKPERIKSVLCENIRHGEFFRSNIVTTTDLTSLPIVLTRSMIPCLENNKLQTFYQPNRVWSPWQNNIWTIKLNRQGQGTIEIRQHRLIPFTIYLSENADLHDCTEENHIIRVDVDTDKTEFRLIRTVEQPQEFLLRSCQQSDQILQTNEKFWHRYWLSFYGKERTISFGMGEVRPKFATISQRIADEFQIWIEHIQYIHFEIPDYIIYQVRESIENNLEIYLIDEPILFDPFPFVISTSEFSLTKPMSDFGVFAPMLNNVSRTLYEDLKRFQLNDELFPNLSLTIEESIRNPNGWCYKHLREKFDRLSTARFNLLSIRIRVDRIGDEILQNPCIMELWPAGHHSPIRTYDGQTFGFIRVLHGKLLTKFFPSLSLSSHNELCFEQLFESDQMIWMMPNINQTYQMTHPDIRPSCSITLQSFSHGMNFNENNIMLVDIDYIVFKEQMRREAKSQ